MTMSRGLFRGNDLPSVDEYEWAETLPQFRSDRAMVSRQGELWLERYLPVDSLPQLAVFDEEGILQGSVQLPPGRRLVGFGTRPDGIERVYLVRKDVVRPRMAGEIPGGSVG